MVKARLNEEVRNLTGRGTGSVEYRFQNISAVLGEIRHPFVAGYKPAVKYQETLRQEVLKQLDLKPALVDLAFTALTRSASEPEGDLNWQVIAPPEVELRRSGGGRRVGHWDFVRLDAENRSLGKAGEVAVVARERQVLTATGRSDLADRVEHISTRRGDGLGFDVLSFGRDGEEKYIEVKTTRQGAHWPMMISRNEVEFSRAEPNGFHLYRVFAFSSVSAGLYELAGPLEETCAMTPVTFQALPALSADGVPTARL